MRPAADKIDHSHQTKNDALVANAAILYYKEGLTQNEIAIRMGVSRPTVINYLRLARQNNIVDIRISGRAFSHSSLSRELREKFGLTDAYVAEFTADTKDHSQLEAKALNHHIARVGAEALFDIVRPGDLIGVSWGETIHLLAGEMPHRNVDDLTVIQMIGSMKSPLISTAESCAIRIASRLGADCYTLHAPAVLSTPELAKALRAEPVIADQLNKFDDFDRTVFSVGSCDTNAMIIQSSITSEADFEWYRSQGAVGVLCGRFIDRDGIHISGAMDERIIGVTLEQVRKAKSGVLVAGGAAKFNAIMATLKGGFVSHLVVDEVTARNLLADGRHG